MLNNKNMLHFAKLFLKLVKPKNEISNEKCFFFQI